MAGLNRDQKCFSMQEEAFTTTNISKEAKSNQRTFENSLEKAKRKEKI
jgi:hypothetical protein